VPEFVERQQRQEALAHAPLIGTFEERLDRRLRDASISWSKENPGRVVELAAIKFVRMWSPLPNAAEFQNWFFRLAVLFGYTPLMIGGIWGAIRYFRRGWPYMLCIAPAIYLTLLHLIFVSSIRYREPAMLSLAVLAAGVICERAGKIKVSGEG
jgi:hypothetical protein